MLSILHNAVVRTATRNKRLTRLMSDSGFGGGVTYSGGHASVGQGGFYGSGGARVMKGSTQHHPEAIARQTDISEIVSIMKEIESMEHELATLGAKVVNSKSIELKSKIKRAISNPKVREILNRLEIKGEPVWGLSKSERDLVRTARSKYLSS